MLEVIKVVKVKLDEKSISFYLKIEVENIVFSIVV